MAWNPGPSLTYLQTVLENTGVFTGGVQIGEPFAPPQDMTAAFYFMEMEPAKTTVATTIDVWLLQLRIYARAGMTPNDAARVEANIANGVSNAEAALAENYTLQHTIRAIDWAGEEAGQKIKFKWGHLTIGGTIFRVADADVPLVVDDSATFAA